MLIGLDASRANRQKKTGTEWYSFYLIKELARLDRHNHYRLYLDKAPSKELQEAVGAAPNFDFRVLPWPLTSFWTLGRLSLEMLFHSPDVLFVPAHGLPLIHPRRTINTIHDVAFAREEEVYREEGPKAKTPARRRLLKSLIKLITGGRYRGTTLEYLNWSTAFSLRHSSTIITVSDFTKQEILDCFPFADPGKIEVVHNGFASELYQPSASSESEVEHCLNRYGITNPYFLYVGRLEKKKNTAALIEALALLREEYPEIKEKLVLIGNASYGYDEIKYAIEEFDLELEVIMPGWVEEDELPLIFQQATAFIFPTKHEGFGIPVLQALASGTPTAVSDLPVLREVAGEAVRYFNHFDYSDIAEAMAEIVLNKELRADLRERGFRQAKKFSWYRCATETLALIENRK